MTNVEIISVLTEELNRLGRAVAKKRRELNESSQSCRGPLDSMDRAGLCVCQLELQSEFDRLSKLYVRYEKVIAHVQAEGAVCAECGEDISARLLKVPSTLCCSHATEAEHREHHQRRLMWPQAALI